MTFEEFNNLTYNRVPLLMAVELLLQNGRPFVENTDRAEIIAAMKKDTKNFMADVMLDEIVKTAKELAPLRACKLMEYVKRSDLNFEVPGEQEAGICPICGGELEYGDDEPIDDGGVIEWTCPSCGATGKEGYSKVFDKHYNVTDGEGNPFPPAD